MIDHVKISGEVNPVEVNHKLGFNNTIFNTTSSAVGLTFSGHRTFDSAINTLTSTNPVSKLCYMIGTVCYFTSRIMCANVCLKGHSFLSYKGPIIGIPCGLIFERG